MKKLVTLLSSALFMCACGNGKPEVVELDLSEYSLACTTGADCTVVDRLACATYCDSEAAPLRADDADDYDGLRAAHADECKVNPFVIDCVGEDDDTWVKNNIALCVAGECTVRPRMDFGPGARPDCQAGDDCQVAETSDPCDCEDVSFSAVSAEQAATIAAERQDVDCGADEPVLSCDSDRTYEAYCEESSGCRLRLVRR